MGKRVEKTEIEESTEVVAAEDCLSTTLDGEKVILHMDAGEYYGFNEVATDIWETIQEPRTVREVSEYLVAEYDIGYDRGKQDTVELMAELDEKGLVRLDN